jgi:hypothetical protein
MYKTFLLKSFSAHGRMECNTLTNSLSLFFKQPFLKCVENNFKLAAVKRQLIA